MWLCGKVHYVQRKMFSRHTMMLNSVYMPDHSIWVYSFAINLNKLKNKWTATIWGCNFVFLLWQIQGIDESLLKLSVNLHWIGFSPLNLRLKKIVQNSPYSSVSYHCKGEIFYQLSICNSYVEDFNMKSEEEYHFVESWKQT